MFALPKDATLTIVARDMQYSKSDEVRKKGKELERITIELGDYLKYVFMMRKPCYLDQDSTLVQLLLDEYNEGDSKGLTMQLVNWLRQNVPHKNYAELEDVHVWSDCMPTPDEIKLYTILNSKKYSLAVGKIKPKCIEREKPQFRLYVWKN